MDKDLIPEFKMDKPLGIHNSINFEIKGKVGKCIGPDLIPTNPMETPCENVIDIYGELSQSEIDAARKDIQESKIDNSSIFDNNDFIVSDEFAKKSLIVGCIETEKGPVNLINSFLQPTELGESIKNPSTNTYETPKNGAVVHKGSILKVDSYDFKLNFGKHNGESIGKIIDYDPQYILWLHDNHIKNIFIHDEILNKALKIKNKLENSTPFRNGFTNADFQDREDDLPF